MEYEREQQRYRFELLDPLEDIRISAAERETLREVMEKADWIAGLLVSAAQTIQAKWEALVSPNAFAKPAPHTMGRTQI